MSYGIRSVTMDDIARELGMSKKTLYQAFENKQAIVEAFATQFLATSMDAENKIHQNANSAVEEMFFVAEHVSKIFLKIPPSAMYDLQKYHHGVWERCDGISRQHVFSLVKENLKRGQTEGLYRAEVNVDVVTLLYVSQGKALTDEDTFSTSTLDKATFFVQMLDYHMNAITTPKGLDMWKSFTKSMINRTI